MKGGFISFNPAWQLANRVISSWKMEEASGNRVDSTPTNSLKTSENDLTANGAPGNTTGIIGNAVALTLASSQSLSIASNTSLRMGSGIRMTLVFWVNFTTLATNQTIVAKQATGPVDEYRVVEAFNLIGGLTPGLQFSVSGNGTTYTSVNATNFGTVSTGVWYFVMCKYDGSNISISINNGTPNTTSFSTDIFSGASAFNIGRANLAVQNYVNGAVDDVTLWKRALTSDEITYLYNLGVGRQWNFTAVSELYRIFPILNFFT